MPGDYNFYTWNLKDVWAADADADRYTAVIGVLRELGATVIAVQEVTAADQAAAMAQLARLADLLVDEPAQHRMASYNQPRARHQALAAEAEGLGAVPPARSEPAGTRPHRKAAAGPGRNRARSRGRAAVDAARHRRDRRPKTVPATRCAASEYR